MKNNTRALITFLVFMVILSGIVYFASQYRQKQIVNPPQSKLTDALSEVTPTPTIFPEDENEIIREASESSQTAKVHFIKPTGGDYVSATNSNPTASEPIEVILEAHAQSEVKIEINHGEIGTARAENSAEASVSFEN